jgi:hypothetical protein
VLIFLEPIVSVALAGLGACLVLTVLVFQVLAHRPGFPWLGLLLAAVWRAHCCGLRIFF